MKYKFIDNKNQILQRLYTLTLHNLLIKEISDEIDDSNNLYEFSINSEIEYYNYLFNLHIKKFNTDFDISNDTIISKNIYYKFANTFILSFFDNYYITNCIKCFDTSIFKNYFTCNYNITHSVKNILLNYKNLEAVDLVIDKFSTKPKIIVLKDFLYTHIDFVKNKFLYFDNLFINFKKLLDKNGKLIEFISYSPDIVFLLSELDSDNFRNLFIIPAFILDNPDVIDIINNCSDYYQYGDINILKNFDLKNVIITFPINDHNQNILKKIIITVLEKTNIISKDDNNTISKLADLFIQFFSLNNDKDIPLNKINLLFCYYNKLWDEKIKPLIISICNYEISENVFNAFLKNLTKIIIIKTKEFITDIKFKSTIQIYFDILKRYSIIHNFKFDYKKIYINESSDIIINFSNIHISDKLLKYYSSFHPNLKCETENDYLDLFNKIKNDKIGYCTITMYKVIMTSL